MKSTYLSVQYYAYYSRRVSFKILLVLVFFLFFSVINVHAQDPNVEAARNAIHNVIATSSGDPTVRTNAIKYLSNFPFKDVTEFIFSQIDQELTKLKPNTYHLAAMGEVLEGIAGQEDVEKIKSAQTRISSELPKKGISSNVTGKIAEVFARAVQPVSHRSNLPMLPQIKSVEFFEILREAAQSGKVPSNLIDLLLKGTERCISDDMGKMANDPDNPKIIGREKEVEDVLKILVRLKSRLPVLVGRAGVGKTSVVEALSLLIHKRELSDWHVFQEEFPAGTVIIETSAARIGGLAKANTEGAQADAIESYLGAVKEVQSKLGVPVIIYIDEMHMLSRGQLNALKAPAERMGGIRLIGATTTNEYNLLVQHDAAADRRFERVLITEPTEEHTFQILKQGWLQKIQKRYRVTITDELLRELIPIASEVHPDKPRPDAQIKLIQDLAIDAASQYKPTYDHPLVVTENMARNYAGRMTGIPINPANPGDLVKYIENGRQAIKKKVVGQDHLVDALVDTWQEVLTSNPERSVKSVAVIGPTGTGKSYAAEQIGDVFLGNKEKVLVIDATAYQTGDISLNSLIGAPNGVVSSDQTIGILPEFINGVGKRSGIIIINEFDKAHPDFAKRIMEMLDRSELTAGNGRVYKVGRVMIVLTTNRGANKIFNRNLNQLSSDEELQNRVNNITEADLRRFFTESEGYESQDKGRLPPETVGRIDRWVAAKPTSFKDAVIIAQQNVDQFVAETKNRYKLNMEVTPEVVEWMARTSYTPADGARPIKKKVERVLGRARSSLWANMDAIKNANVKITISKNQNGDTEILATDSNTSRGLSHLTFADPVKFMAIKDPRFYELLQNMGPKIKSEITGHDEVIDRMVSMTRRKVIQPYSPRPMVYGFFGPTGVGKTALAKTYAKVVYGNEKRAHIFEFGKIQHKFDLANIFNPPKGVIGSDSPSPFEQILIAFEESGGVLVFDEFTNMGESLSIPEREALYKYFYDIFEEGRWVSEKGKEYDLSKFTIILTGNAGEEIFNNAANDDIRGKLHQEYNNREEIEKILLKRGLSRPLVNRIGDMFLFKPLAEENKPFVLKKFFNEFITPIESANNVKIVFTKDFEEKVSKAFFPLKDGARGARRFVENDLVGFISDFIFDHYFQIQSSKKPISIEIGMDLNIPENHWAVDHKTEVLTKIKARAAISDSTGHQPEEKTLERVIKATSAPIVRTVEEARITSRHEGGHALVNEHLGHPYGALEYLTIIPSGNNIGYARYDNKRAPESAQTLNRVLREMAVAAGGMVAQELDGIDRDSGWSGGPGSDKDHLTRMAYSAVAELGLVPGLEAYRADKPGLTDAATKRKINKAVNALVEKSIELAREVLSRPEVKTQMQTLTKALIERGHLYEQEYHQVIGQVKVSESLVPIVNQKITEVRGNTKIRASKSCGDLMSTLSKPPG